MTHPPSLAERIRPVKADAAIVAAFFLGDAAVFVLGEEALLFVSRAGETRRVPAHAGAILAAACDGARVVTGGDDGVVAATDASGVSQAIATDPKRRWIDHVALGRDDVVAWSAGRQAFVRTRKGEERVTEAPSTVGGLAFAPKGLRLAISHYNGATLWFPNAQAAPQRLEWKGSHLAVSFSPDGAFLATAMQEPMLHGWRLADGQHMRMAGYARKVRWMRWSADGKWLATSGANELVLWPFQSKEGPAGKNPRLLAPAERPVSAIACHPQRALAAVGYEHGQIKLVRFEDGAEILARPAGEAAISALAWAAGGAMLAFGAELGEAGVIAM